MTTDVFKVKPKARLHVGAALNNVKLAATAASYDEFKAYIAAANTSLSAAMKEHSPVSDDTLALFPGKIPDKK